MCNAEFFVEIYASNFLILGATVVVTQPIPPHSLVVGIPAKVIKSNIHASDYY